MIIYIVYIFFLEKYCADLTIYAMRDIIKLRCCIEVRGISLFILQLLATRQQLFFCRKRWERYKSIVKNRRYIKIRVREV